jgi:hypothetical protein
MKLAIMQPYFFPYLGYFQLINAVDLFVVYDDVTYIKQGWINRNYILVDGKRLLMTLRLDGASSFKLINQVRVGSNATKLIKTISQAYSKAPYFEDIFPIIDSCLNYKENNLAIYIMNSLLKIAAYLNIKTNFIFSSSIEKDNSLRGQEKVLNICNILGATEYINAFGGQTLYSEEDFNSNLVKLYFLKTNDIIYNQCENEFIPNLSIIDILMFNSRNEIKQLLDEYELI